MVSRFRQMPPRLNKRQQRELEELEALKSSEALNVPSDDEEPGPSERHGGGGGVFMNVRILSNLATD